MSDDFDFFDLPAFDRLAKIVDRLFVRELKVCPPRVEMGGHDKVFTVDLCGTGDHEAIHRIW